MWKLTPEQLQATIWSLLPEAPALSDRVKDTLTAVKFFSNDASALDMTQPHVSSLLGLATDLADHTLESPSRMHECLSTGFDDRECVRDAIASFGSRAFRRPLEPPELMRYLDLYDGRVAMGSPRQAVWQVIRALMLSPHFLFRTELGDLSAGDEATVTLTAHERASALSYLLTNGPPDEELLRAAENGELEDAAGLEAHARRLFEREAGFTGAIRFLSEALGSGVLLSPDKDPELFPNFDAELVASLEAEPERFFAHVLREDDGRFATLLTAPYSVVDAGLAELYEVPTPAGDDFEFVELPTDQRAGFLTQPGLLAGLARSDEGDVVRRGLFIREALMCGQLPPPPMDANAVPPPPDPDLTQRERMVEHSEDPGCAACHDLIDPQGFALEHYDAIGQWRDTDNGHPIDASGALVLDDETVEFADAVELAHRLAESREVQACFVRHSFEYALGVQRDEDAAVCGAEAAESAFFDSDGDVLEVMVGILRSPAFVERSR